MTGDRWTFLVVADEDTPVKQYSVSARGLRLAAGVVGAGLVTVLGLILFMLFGGASGVHTQRLEARNQALNAELERFRGRVDQLEQSMDGLASRDAQLRNLAGLESLDPEVLEAGVGGPGLGALESYPLFEIDPDASGDAYALAYDLGALERRARLLSESLDEATDSLQAHRDLLESTPSILPTTGWLSSGFSRSRMHPVHNRPLPHEGVDIAANEGTPIYAAAKGRVVRAGWMVGYGLTVEIDHGYGYTTLYGHASKVLARRGQEVSRGDVIAQVGSTGITTSSNLHYEVRVNGVPQNPANFILPAAVP
ncbi:MAG: M23 family metallopeptidase [Longimicrobiales bacterium]